MTNVYVIGVAKKKQELVGMMYVHSVVYDDKNLHRALMDVAKSRISVSDSIKACPDPYWMEARLNEENFLLWMDEALGDEMIVVERHEVVG